MKREIDEELRFHLEQRTAENIAAGMAPEEAAREARKRFGNVQSIREECRVARGASVGETTLQDVRFGFRMLRKNPGFTTVAVLVLALGIGANTAVFSLVNAVLLHSPISEKGGTPVNCYARNRQNPDQNYAFNYSVYRQLREPDAVFSSMAAYDDASLGVEENDGVQRRFVFLVSANYFKTLGVRPACGRDFLSEEELPDARIPVAIVSHRFWQETGADPQFVGKVIHLQGRAFTVIGIMSEGVTGSPSNYGPSLWLPLGMHQTLLKKGELETAGCLKLVGRLRPELGLAGARARLPVINDRLEKAFPALYREREFFITPLYHLGLSNSPKSDAESWSGPVLLLAITSMVLLIACLNVANMLLARNTARRREIAIRLALGGGRGRVLRQLFTEGTLLGVLGGCAGVLLATWATKPLYAFMLTTMRNRFSVELGLQTSLDWRILALTLGLGAASAILFSLVPALKLARVDVVSDLKQQVGDDFNRGKRRRFWSLRNLLVIGQIGLSLALLSTAGLFVRSTLKALQANPGFPLDRSIIVKMDLGLVNYNGQKVFATCQSLVERLKSLPEVESASLASVVPFGDDAQENQVRPEGAGEESQILSHFAIVGADYFQTLGIPLLQGREFGPGDVNLDLPLKVAVLDETLAQKLFPKGNALGRRVRIGDKSDESVEVVGIVRGIRQQSFDRAPAPLIYVPFGQELDSSMNLHVRGRLQGAGAGLALLRTVREQIRSLDARLPVLALETLREHQENSPEMIDHRIMAELLLIFAAIAATLAVMGVYAVNAYVVSRRTRELGIRMALGANRTDVLRLILREGAVLLSCGLGIGLLLSVAAGRVVNNQLYGITACDPVTLCFATLLLAVAALTALWLPARRAARVNPMEALRCE